MNHCQGCLVSDLPNGVCPGCGHEDRIATLEAKLAKAQPGAWWRIQSVKNWIQAADWVIELQQERDALKAALKRMQKALESAKSAITEAICDEEGLDGVKGSIVLDQINAAIAALYVGKGATHEVH